MAKSGRSQGGIIGIVNKTSFGKNKVTKTTATGTFTTQPGTTILNALVVAGGGGGGAGRTPAGNSGGGGGAGAGGVRQSCCVSVCGATGYSVTLGGG